MTRLARRQDRRGGWHADAGYALDAAQCVFEGFCTYERLTGDDQFHQVMVRAADRMITGTIDAEGTLLIDNFLEVGEYAHFAFLAWKQTDEERYLEAARRIIEALMDTFDEAEGYWATTRPAVATGILRLMPLVSPLLRASIRHLRLGGRVIARISGAMLPWVTRGCRPQYALGLMTAESLLDTLDGSIELPRLRDQTARALTWAEQNCSGPTPGCLAESRPTSPSEAVYPLPAINDSERGSVWPTAVYLLALIGMNEPDVYGGGARQAAEWILSMQAPDGSFSSHGDGEGRPCGGVFGNVNFYAAMALWYARLLLGDRSDLSAIRL